MPLNSKILLTNFEVVLITLSININARCFAILCCSSFDLGIYVCRYEGRCGLPTNFDAAYCYALGYAAGALLHSGKTGLISSVIFAFILISENFLSFSVLIIHLHALTL